jgi:hypothetical protein
MATSITIGENYISEISLLDSDGNSINLSAIENISVQIRQYNRVVETIPEGDAKLTAGTTADKLKIELSEETSLKLREGKVYARVSIGDTNALYTDDAERISLPDYHILTMYAQLPEDDETVTTVIEHSRGAYDASGNVMPSTGGAGTGGAILAGDFWYLSVAGTLFGTPYAVNTRIEARINSPGQTQANWYITTSQG